MIKVALPAGDLRPIVGGLLAEAGLPVEGYLEGSRAYRLGTAESGITFRVFREKDIPIQVGLGNYDLGVCSLAWVRDLEARFSRRPIIPLCDLGVARSGIYAATSKECPALADLASLRSVRVATEYPNLAESFARTARLPRYRIQAVWGAAEAYPPEDADCVIVSAVDEDSLTRWGLQPLFCLLDNSAWLIGNAGAVGSKELRSVLSPLMSVSRGVGAAAQARPPFPASVRAGKATKPSRRAALRMALPDGHQQRHVVGALSEAGLSFNGYGDGAAMRRPVSAIDGLELKVIRPHDMPQLVAGGEMDIAITGRDCLMEHLYSFPTSPVVEILDLQRAQYNLWAVVSEELGADSIAEALELWRGEGRGFLRVAAEFPATADHYARSRHFWRYQIIPISGASEGFVPEDADLLIEGTETGRTLAENQLKPVDLLYRSTTCLIGHRDPNLEGKRRSVYDDLLSVLQPS